MDRTMSGITVFPGLLVFLVCCGSLVQGACNITTCTEDFEALVDPCTEPSRLVALDTCVTSMTDTCTPTLASGFSARLQVLRGRCADPCAVTPLTAPLCRNGGVCNANQLTFTCACPTDWTGDQCETAIDYCQADPAPSCPGTCIPTRDSFRCSCDAGFQWDGTDCVDVDECVLGHNCQSVCTNTAGSFTCSCLDGYTLDDDNRTCARDASACVICVGDNQACSFSGTTESCLCDLGFENDGGTGDCTNIDECATPSPCDDQANCTNEEPGFLCACPPGTSLGPDGLTCQACSSTQWGDNCAEECSACNGDNTERCEAAGGCVCLPGWSGVVCSDDVAECLADPAVCGPDDTCEERDGAYACICAEGFVNGNDAETNPCEDFDECIQPFDNDCGPGGICVNQSPGHTCNCSSGFSLNVDDVTCTDIDECDQTPPVCSDNGICTDTEGSYECVCNEGYQLNDDSSTCIDIDECEQTPPVCSDNGICTNTEGSYECVCNEGYQLNDDSSTCIDINECSIPSTFSCPEDNTRCENVPGNYTCVCMDGFSGDPCEDIDECDLEPPVCSDNGNCTNTDGSYECICDEGYQLNDDSSTCVDTNECLTVDLCEVGMDCKNTDGSFECNCKEGFKPAAAPDVGCVDIDECMGGVGPCEEDSTCANTVGGFTCTCPPGYIHSPDDPITCRDEDECIDRPGEDRTCDQRCSNTEGSFSCSCNEGFLLVDEVRCVDIDDCEQSDVCPEGTCSDKLREAICLCATTTRAARRYVINFQFTLDMPISVQKAVYGIREILLVEAKIANVVGCMTPNESVSIVDVAIDVAYLVSAAELAALVVLINEKTKNQSLDSGSFDVTIEEVRILTEFQGQPRLVGDLCSVFDVLSICFDHGDCELKDDQPTCKCDSGYGGEFCEERNGLSRTSIIVLGVCAPIGGLLLITFIILMVIYFRRTGSPYKQSSSNYRSPRFEDPRAHSVPDKDSYQGSLFRQVQNNGSWWHQEGHHTRRTRASAFNPASFASHTRPGWGPTENNWHDSRGRDGGRRDRGGRSGPGRSPGGMAEDSINLTQGRYRRDSPYNYDQDQDFFNDSYRDNRNSPYYQRQYDEYGSRTAAEA